MSAYLVSRATIDALVAGAKAQGPGTYFWYAGEAALSCEFANFASDDEADDNQRFNEDTLGRMLWTENLISINARYPDTVDHPEAVPGSLEGDDVAGYTYGPGIKVVNLDPLGVLGVIRGYQYQACEHQGWRNSIAKAFVNDLEARIVRKLIDLSGANPWTIDSLKEITGETQVIGSGRHPTHTDDSRPAHGWTIEFRPGASAAVSITDMIAANARQGS